MVVVLWVCGNSGLIKDAHRLKITKPRGVSGFVITLDFFGNVWFSLDSDINLLVFSWDIGFD